MPIIEAEASSFFLSDITGHMNCPNCQNRMSRGELTLRSSWLGIVRLGLARVRLWFKDETSEKPILNARDTVPAFRCTRCGTVVLQRNASDVLSQAAELEQQGDLKGAAERYKAAEEAGLEPEYCRARIEEMGS